jgi:hypothetical protein
MRSLLIALLCSAVFDCGAPKVKGPEMLLGRWEGKSAVVHASGSSTTGPSEVILEFRPDTVKVEYLGENPRTLESSYKTRFRREILEVDVDGELFLVSFDGTDHMRLGLNEAARRKPDVSVLATLRYHKIDKTRREFTPDSAEPFVLLLFRDSPTGSRHLRSVEVLFSRSLERLVSNAALPMSRR